MIEEYETWEDSIRRTFIELANYIYENTNEHTDISTTEKIA